MEDVRSQEGPQDALQGEAAGLQQQPSSTATQQDSSPVQQQQQQQQHDTLEQCNKLLARKEAEVVVLQRKLEHYRSWLSSLQGQMQHKDPQVLKNARRLYVGGIPDDTRESELRQFFDSIMSSTGASCGPGSSIVTCKISSDKSYAFLEMRSVEEASNAMAFDGVVFKDTNLKIRRPSNYVPSEANSLGPVTPDPTIDTSGLPMCKTVVEDSWNKIFIGGLPCHYTDEQVKELLAPFGALKSFNLVMDKNTGKSKGYAFCEFIEQRSIPAVIEGLHMSTLERKVLTVKRALEGGRQGGRMSGTPLGAFESGPSFGGPSSSGSSRGASGFGHHPAHLGGGIAPMRSGSYSSSSQQFGGGQRMPGVRGGGGDGGSGSASPMHAGGGGGGHRYSPHHHHHGGGGVGGGGGGGGGGGHVGSPGGLDPFGQGPGPHMMGGPGHSPHHYAGLGGYGPMGFYHHMAGPGVDSPGGHMMSHHPHGMMGGPGPGPLAGWPTHGMFGPGHGGRPQRVGGQQQQQQQQGPRGGAGSSGYGTRGSSWGGPQQQPGGGCSSRGGQRAGGGGDNGAAAAGSSQQTPGTPSPVPPTPGAATGNRPAAASLSPGIGGGAATAAAALAGAASSGSEPPVGHNSSGTGSSSLYQHSSSMGSGSAPQRPSDAGSTAEASH